MLPRTDNNTGAAFVGDDFGPRKDNNTEGGDGLAMSVEPTRRKGGEVCAGCSIVKGHNRVVPC